MTDLAGADRRSQWFHGRYPGARMAPNVLVLHTTEGGSWPGYNTGATAPHLTVRANKRTRTLDVRQHFPLNRSSRALRNESGGVQTNTANTVQVELVGSCDRRDGFDAIYWPDAPEWCYVELGKLLARINRVCPGIPLRSGLTWRSYPESYGATPVRMTFAEWRRFRGVCGHQHVPENSHGDPGDMPIDRILNYARGGAQEVDDMTPAQEKLLERAVSAAERAAAAADRADRRAGLALARGQVNTRAILYNRKSVPGDVAEQIEACDAAEAKLDDGKG